MKTILTLVINTKHGEVRLEYENPTILPQEASYLDLLNVSKHKYFKKLTDIKKKQLLEIEGNDYTDGMDLFTTHYMQYLYPDKYEILIIMVESKKKAIEETKYWYAID